MSRRRPQLEVFGASLLDMMMCGFGAVLLLFIVQRSATGGRIEKLNRQIAVTEAVSDRVRGQPDETEGSFSAARDRSPGPSTMGVPIADGAVVFLIDESQSMVDYGPAKRDRAFQLLKQSMAHPRGPDEALIIFFAGTVRKLGGWSSPPADRGEWADSLTSRVRDAFTPAAETNLVGAIDAAIDALAERGSRGTIVLFSDGLHNFSGGSNAIPDAITAEDLVTRVRVHTSDAGFANSAITIHTVGLFDWPTKDNAWLDRPGSLARVRQLLRDRLQAGGDERVTSSQAAASQLINASDSQLLDGQLGFRLDVQAFMAPPQDLQLGDTLYRLSGAFGGRFLGIAVDPFAENAAPEEPSR